MVWYIECIFVPRDGKIEFDMFRIQLRFTSEKNQRSLTFHHVLTRQWSFTGLEAGV